jgi:hypothetical protein
LLRKTGPPPDLSVADDSGLATARRSEDKHHHGLLLGDSALGPSGKDLRRKDLSVLLLLQYDRYDVSVLHC